MNKGDFLRKENTRDEIINAAYCLYLENGYHGTSMRAIANEAGISLGGIYNHFASKEEIFVTVIYQHHPFRELVARLDQARGETLEELLFDAERCFDEVFPQNPDGYLKLLFIEIIEFKSQHIAQLFDKIYPQLDQLAKRIFNQRPNPGEYHSFFLLRAFLGLLFSYRMTEWMFGSLLPEETSLTDQKNFVEIFLHGILSEKTLGDSA